MQEISLNEYTSTLDKWQKDKDEEAKKKEQQIKEDDWKCEVCGNLNKMIKSDVNSAICTKCRQKNEMIEYMIKFANDNESTK